MSPASLPLDPRDRVEIERILAPVLRRHGSGGVRLFGSRARGDARLASDIDIAIASTAPTPALELALLREQFEESHVPFRVDLVDYMAAPPELRAVIDREGIPWPV